jgi:hypothetical protein
MLYNYTFFSQKQEVQQGTTYGLFQLSSEDEQQLYKISTEEELYKVQLNSKSFVYYLFDNFSKYGSRGGQVEVQERREFPSSGDRWYVVSFTFSISSGDE